MTLPTGAFPVRIGNIQDVFDEIMKKPAVDPTKVPTPVGPTGGIDPTTGKILAAVHEPTHSVSPGVNLYEVAGAYIKTGKKSKIPPHRLVLVEPTDGHETVYLCDGERAGFFTLMPNTMETRWNKTVPGDKFKYSNMTFQRLTNAEIETLVSGKVFGYLDAISSVYLEE